MNRSKVIKTLNICLVILFVITTLQILMGIGAGGIMNDMDIVYEEMQTLEKQGLLDNPPPTISSFTKYELNNFRNSSEVKEYIKSLEKSAYYQEIGIFVSFVLFLIAVVLRICFRKPKNVKNNQIISSS